MSYFEKVFTDAIKDVIGNDPVLDQFDISYVPSFYGTTVDDYITGSLISEQIINGRRILIEGQRGKYFSKYYSNSVPPLGSIYGSPDVLKVPDLSYRQVPWNERISKISNRVIQCYDSSERYYDSCIPDLKHCFNVNNSKVWKLESQAALSPYGNVDIDNNGFMIFNSIPLDRTSDGYLQDPTVNNEWTWSFPYENKYRPNNRLVKTNSSLGINSINLTAELNYEVSSSYFMAWNSNLENLTSLDGESISIKGIIPILPGNLGSQIDSFGGKNALRGVFSGSTLFSAKGLYGVDSLLNSKQGISLLIPSDVNLNQYADHSFLGALSPSVSDPGNELLTGSMTIDDSLKFFFGFGDLNNMTYSQFVYSEISGSYLEDFELGGLITYYFSGTLGSAQAPRAGSSDLRLIKTLPEYEQFVRNTAEVGPYGWQTVTIASANPGNWISDTNDPNTTTIPAGSWDFYLNCYGTGASQTKEIRARIFKWDGATESLLGTTEIKTLPNSITYLSLTWTIPSPITILTTDRILIKIESNLSGNVSTSVFRTYHDYLPLGMLRRYSKITTNVPLSYNPNVFYTQAKNLSTYNQGGLSVNWGNSPTTKPWCTIYRSGSTTIGADNYNYWGPGPLSGTISPSKRGLFGLNSRNQDFILYTSGSYDVSQQEYSICCMDITSSYPWTLRYDRAVAGKEDLFFESYISGYPGVPSGQVTGGPFREVEILDVVTGSNNDPAPGTSPPTKKYYHDYFTTFDSGLLYGGTENSPTTFPPGEWRVNFKLDWDAITSSPTNEFVMAGIDNIEITTYSIDGNPSGPKIGGNNYPHFRTYRVDPRRNEVVASGTGTLGDGTKSIHESNIFGISPVIRGWKYGLYSAIPMNSKVVFRRDKFGHFRDMLEQRQYTKFINVEDSPSDDDATTKRGFNRFTQSRILRSISTKSVGPSVVEASFFRQRYSKDDRGIGYIYNEKVNPLLTVSQNISSEVTSSLPYFDGEAKLRQESDLALITDATLTSLQIGQNGLTVI